MGLLLFYFLIGKVFAIITGLYFFRSLTRAYRLTLLLTLVATIVEVVGYYLHAQLRQNNVWLFNYYMIFEVWMLGLASLYLVKNKTVQISFVALLLLDTAVWIHTIATNPITVFASFPMVCGCIALTVIYLVVLLSNSLFSQNKILNQPIFWLCIANILYFSCDIPVMGLHNFLYKTSPSIANKLSIINTVLDIVRYPLVGVSFLMLGRQKSPKQVPITT
jgi:hypothetical protein